MSINTKISLFKVYIKPLLYYGAESLDLNIGDINDIKKCEATIVKQLVGISKYCHTNELFSALNIEPAEETIRILKLKFIQRMNKNEYTSKFMEELRCVNKTNGSLKRIAIDMDLSINANMNDIINNIDGSLEKIRTMQHDKFKYNPIVNQIKDILEIQNNKFRTFKLYKKRGNNNYQPMLRNDRLVKAKNNITNYFITVR
jgi:hypothetical protein